jgi:hypothetical protein
MVELEGRQGEGTMKARAPALILGLLLVAAGCHLFDDEDSARIHPFENIEESEFLAVTEPDARVFLDEDEWKAFWTDHSEEEAPDVDFAQEMTIGLFWGSGYSGCTNRAEAIREVREGNSRVVVEVGPLGSLGDCDMVVLPNQVIRLDRIDKPVVFEGEAPGT